MEGLHLSNKLTLPYEAVTRRFTILGKSGSGKTYTASGFVEEMLKPGFPVVVIDPTGVWWGLRSSADGDGPGFPVVIAGGDHADVPLDATSGKTLAELVVSQQASLVLDLWHLDDDEQNQLVADFADWLYRHNSRPLHLVIDEADLFAPQQLSRGQRQRTLKAVNNIVRRGRVHGLGTTLITQRPAALNNDVLYQTDILIALQLVGPADLKAIDDWVRRHGSEEQRKQLLQSLPSLPVGTAWFFDPGWRNLFQQVNVRQRETFDSSRTPSVGTVLQQPKQMAAIDLTRIRRLLEQSLEQTKSEDPEVLRQQIGALKRQLQAQQAGAAPEPPRVEIKEVRVPVITSEQIKTLREQATSLVTIGQELIKAVERPTAKVVEHLPVLESPKRQRTGPTRPPESGPSAGEARLLAVLAAHHTLTRTQLATLARYSARSGTYSSYLSKLRTAGLIEGTEGGGLRLSASGRVLVEAEGLMSQEPTDALAAWRQRLNQGERRVFDALIEAHPTELSRTTVAERAGLSPRSGTFSMYLAKLRRNHLIEVQGSKLRANRTLFALPGA